MASSITNGGAGVVVEAQTVHEIPSLKFLCVQAVRSSDVDWLAQKDQLPREVLAALAEVNVMIVANYRPGTEKDADRKIKKPKTAPKYVVEGKYGTRSSIRLVEVADPHRCLELSGHSELSRIIAMPPTSSIIVSVAKSIRVWGLAQQLLLREFGEHAHAYVALIALDPVHIVTGSEDKSARMWNIDTGDCLRTWSLYSDGVRCAAIVPRWNSRRFIVGTGSGDRGLYLMDIGEDAPVGVMHVSTDSIRGCAVQMDGVHAACGGVDSRLHLLRLDTCKVIRSCDGHTNTIWDLCASATGGWITGSADKSVIQWSLDGQKLRQYTGMRDWVWTVASLPNGNIAASSDIGMAIWDRKSGEIEYENSSCSRYFAVVRGSIELLDQLRQQYSSRESSPSTHQHRRASRSRSRSAGSRTGSRSQGKVVAEVESTLASLAKLSALRKAQKNGRRSRSRSRTRSRSDGSKGRRNGSASAGTGATGSGSGGGGRGPNRSGSTTDARPAPPRRRYRSRDEVRTGRATREPVAASADECSIQ